MRDTKIVQMLDIQKFDSDHKMVRMTITNKRRIYQAKHQSQKGIATYIINFLSHLDQCLDQSTFTTKQGVQEMYNTWRNASYGIAQKCQGKSMAKRQTQSDNNCIH